LSALPAILRGLPLAVLVLPGIATLTCITTVNAPAINIDENRVVYSIFLIFFAQPSTLAVLKKIKAVFLSGF